MPYAMATRGKAKSRARQLSLFAGVLSRRAKTKDGRVRKRPGRKVRDERKGFVPHVTRPFHDANHPVHVTMHRVAGGPSLKQQVLCNAILREIDRANGKRKGAQIVDYAIQVEHIHLIVEGEDRLTISRAMQQLFSRITFMINALMGRHGRLFRDRHHRRELSSPTQVRRALVYVLFNDRHHVTVHDYRRREVNRCSSIVWFDDWSPESKPDDDALARARRLAPLNARARPGTWLARAGWKRAGGPIRFDERPRLATCE